MDFARSGMLLGAVFRPLAEALRDLAPIIAVIVFFQLVVLQRPMPDIGRMLTGLACVAGGLALFVQGLRMGLFPMGEAMARAFARKGSAAALFAFAFCLGFGTTLAEPALVAIAAKAAEVAAAAGQIDAADAARRSYALSLRVVVAAAVGAAIVVGALRILKGWPLHRLLIGGYAIAAVLTAFAPDDIVGIAYDAGGVTTSTLTVPLATALGVGLAQSIRGRNPLADGFGLIALASLTPMIFVLLYGLIA